MHVSHTTLVIIFYIVDKISTIIHIKAKYFIDIDQFWLNTYCKFGLSFFANCLFFLYFFQYSYSIT